LINGNVISRIGKSEMLKYVFRWSSTLPLYGEISSQDATTVFGGKHLTIRYHRYIISFTNAMRDIITSLRIEMGNPD
jgi:hypothetical protein